MSTEATRKKSKRRCWVKTLLKKQVDYLHLQALTWKVVVGFDIYKNGSIRFWIIGDCYCVQNVLNIERKIKPLPTFFFTCWFETKMWTFDKQTVWPLADFLASATFLLLPILRQQRFHSPFNDVHISSYTERNLSSIFRRILILWSFDMTFHKHSWTCIALLNLTFVLWTTRHLRLNEDVTTLHNYNI